MSLTDNQKKLLQWIVEQVRAGNLAEDSIWYIKNFTGCSWVGYKGSDSCPPVTFATLDILEEYRYIKGQKKDSNQYKGALTGKAYRKFGLKPRPFRTALSYNGKSDNQAKN
jgi:hypothetical protein